MYTALELNHAAKFSLFASRHTATCEKEECGSVSELTMREYRHMTILVAKSNLLVHEEVSADDEEAIEDAPWYISIKDFDDWDNLDDARYEPLCDWINGCIEYLESI